MLLELVPGVTRNITSHYSFTDFYRFFGLSSLLMLRNCNKPSLLLISSLARKGFAKDLLRQESFMLHLTSACLSGRDTQPIQLCAPVRAYEPLADARASQ